MKRNLLRTLCCLLVAACAGLQLNAAVADDLKVLVVELQTGDMEDFLFADQPVVSFEGEKVLVTSSVASTEYERNDVKKFYFAAQATAIADAQGKSAFSFEYIDNQTVRIKGNGLSEASLYNAEGKLVAKSQAAGESISVSLNGYAPGVYILSVPGHTSLKIVKK